MTTNDLLIDQPAIFTLEFTQTMQDDLLPILADGLDLEIEILQSEVEDLGNGLTKFTIKIYDQEKVANVRTYMLRLMQTQKPILN